MIVPLPDALLGFDYKDQRSRETWALNHAADHQEIQQAIQRQGGPNLQIWELYPVNFRDWDAFALRHQSAHNSMNAVFGMEGSDLMGVDFNDPKSSEEWHALHFKEHDAARTKLRI
jgi:hypothetical protein